MGRIRKLIEKDLVNGVFSTDVYPVTSTQAVYTKDNEKISDVYAAKSEAIVENNNVVISLKNENGVIIDSTELPIATSSTGGIITAEDKNKIDDIEARIQGRSSKSDPIKDPFVTIEAGNSEQLSNALDRTLKGGKYRILFGGNTLLELIVCEKYSGNIIQSISGFIELRDYGIDVSDKKNTLIRIRKEDTWENWEVIEGSYIRQLLLNEINRSYNADEELLKRIEGTSENSSPYKDSFKFAGNYNTSTIEDFLAWLDTLYSSTVDPSKTGFFRVRLNDNVLEITSSPIRYTDEYYKQIIRGRVSINATSGNLTSSYEYNILERDHNSTDGWKPWRIVASADYLDKLQKQIVDNKNEIADIIGEAPETLDTIHEIAEWINNDESGAVAMANEISKNANAITAEADRAKGVEGELVKRILGTSVNSSALNDSFVKKECANFDSLKLFLDEECISSSTYNGMTNRVRYTGHTKLYLVSSLWADVYLYARDYTNGCYSQVIKGNICIKNGELVNLSKPNMPYVTAWRVANNNVWGEWQTTDGNLVGKTITCFGGSMCHLAVAKGSLTQYVDETKTETITEQVGFIREQLESYGATVNNYAISASGFIQAVNGNTIYTQALKAPKSDIYIIWASTNDWTANTASLGNFDDYQRDGRVETICGGLNATISTLVDKNKDAKIYVFLPMKGYDSRGFDLSNGKYGNAMCDIVTTGYKNSQGFTFGEYINAVVKVCCYRGITVVDTFTGGNITLAQIANSASTKLYWNEGLVGNGNGNYIGYYIHPRREGYRRVWGTIKKSLLGEYGENITFASDVNYERERAVNAETNITKEVSKIKDTITEEKQSLLNGNTIVGQSREIYSRNGKTITDNFLTRTTSGSSTIGDGVATLKSVGGNIVKNCIDGRLSKLNNWGNATHTYGSVINVVNSTGFSGVRISEVGLVVGHKYYFASTIVCATDLYITIQSITTQEEFARINHYSSAGYRYMSCIVDGIESVCNIVYRNRAVGSFDILPNAILVNLTEMYGAGNEPTLDECDKLFGTMDALPQGLTIANPTEFKSTGFNQFNPANVIENKAIVNNAITGGDKTLAIIPCLPCKVGVGKNNGYCIHGEFGEDIKVYLTPLNPMDVTGELYMHELVKDETTQTYVPQIKGYMIVEVPTTNNLCVHLKWSADRNEYDYEPYHESAIKLPNIPEMSEYGLAGIQSSGTLACDEIDFERGVYIKRIGAVDMGSLSWRTSKYQDIYPFFVNIEDIVEVLGGVGNIASMRYAIKKFASVNSTTLPDKSILQYKKQIFVNDGAYTDVVSFKAAMQGEILYYELAEPVEYPLPKVDTNYISSDYGVEQFNSSIPCNANNLYYMRSLAGETRNFLDQLYHKTDKSDAVNVANYIAEEIKDNKQSIEDEINRAIEAESELQHDFEILSGEVATNEKAITDEVQRAKDAEAAAIEKGRQLALRDLYIAAGALYNDTTAPITRTAPWGEEVQHLAGHYYLNGLGDLTHVEMAKIYSFIGWEPRAKCRRGLQSFSLPRTLFKGISTIQNREFWNNYIPELGFYGNTSIVALPYGDLSYNGIDANLMPLAYQYQSEGRSLKYFCGGCRNLRAIGTISATYIKNFGTDTEAAFYNCSKLEFVNIYSLNVSITLASSPLFSKKSLLYMITNASPTSAITITLHPDAYARLAEDSEIVQALTAQPYITLVSA